MPLVGSSAGVQLAAVFQSEPCEPFQTASVMAKSATVSRMIESVSSGTIVNV